jgi:hypothetical protein
VHLLSTQLIVSGVDDLSVGKEGGVVIMGSQNAITCTKKNKKQKQQTTNNKHCLQTTNNKHCLQVNQS